jgi:peptidoglycan biosynthesis protein MviN/MurJ (putative lipid II flippase)
VNLIGGAITGTALPVLSTIAAESRIEDAKKVIDMNLKLLILIALPLTAVIITTSEPILNIILKGSALELDQIGKMSLVISLYSSGLIISVLIPFSTTIYSAFSMHKILLMNGAIFLIFNIFINHFFIGDLGLYSLPLARIISNLIIIFFTYYILKKKLFSVLNRSIIYFFLKIILCTTPMYLILSLLINTTKSYIVSQNIIIQATTYVSIVLISVTFFIVACKIFKVKELNYFLNKVLKNKMSTL